MGTRTSARGWRWGEWGEEPGARVGAGDPPACLMAFLKAGPRRRARPRPAPVPAGGRVGACALGTLGTVQALSPPGVAVAPLQLRASLMGSVWGSLLSAAG